MDSRAIPISRVARLLTAVVVAFSLHGSDAALDSSIVPTRFLTARTAIGTDPLFLYYFPECVTGGTSFADSISPSSLGALSSPTTPVCPSNDGFTNSNNGVVVDGTRGTSLSGFQSANQLSGTITDFSIELWVRTTSALDAPSAQYVLFEVAESAPGGSGFGWLCAQEFALRLVYQASISELLFQYKPTGSGSCSNTDASASFTFTSGQLYHIVISVDAVSGIDIIIDGSSQATGSTNLGDLDLASVAQSFVYVGDSPGALSTSLDGTVFPWDGEILLAAFYTGVALTTTQAGNLRTAFLPNSRPAVKTSSRVGEEDNNLTITFSNLVDYYDEDEKSSTVTATIQFIVESTPSFGDLFDSTGLISVSGGAHTIVGTLRYFQSTPNSFNFSDSFTYSVDDQIAAKTAAATMNLFIGATNDVPTADDINIQTPAFQIATVTFQGRDQNDCAGPTCEDGFAPIRMDTVSVGNSFGQLRRVNGGTQTCEAPLGTPITGGENFILDSQGQFVACYEAAGDDTINSNGIVGVDTITYTVSDAFETSSAGTVTVTVTSVLSVLSTFIHVQNEDEVTESVGNVSGLAFNKSYAIELVGVDNKCDDVIGENVVPKVGVLGCPRVKEYAISRPLPTSGTILVDDDGVIKAVTEADLNAEGFYVVPGNGSRVIFLPEANFFNAAPHPLCKNNIVPGVDTQISICAIHATTPADPYQGPACTGPLCSDTIPFTTTSFNGTFGFCSETECPGEIHYRLKIGLAISEEDSTADVNVFVKSTLDRTPLVFSPARSLAGNQRGYAKNTNTPVRTSNNEPMLMNPIDQNQRILEVRFVLAGSASQSRIQVEPVFLGTKPRNDDLQYDGCWFQGCEPSEPLDLATIATFPSQLDQFMENLQYFHIDNTKNLEENLNVIVRDIYEFTGAAENFDNNLLILVLNFESSGGGGNGILSDIQFIAIASAVGLLILMCLISYCGCLGTRARNLTRSCFKVQSLLSRDNEVPYSASAERKSLRNSRDLQGAERAMRQELHKRHAGERFVLKLLWCASVLCPCCCTYDPKKVKIETDDDDERKMIAFLQQKLAHAPKDDDRTHVIDEEHWTDWRLEYDEQDHPFWWNQRTGQSQWYSPFPEGHPMLEQVKKQHLEKEGLRGNDESIKKDKRGAPPKPKKNKKRKPPPKPKGKKPKNGKLFEPKPPPGPKLDR